jgi:hypothetical protein
MNLKAIFKKIDPVYYLFLAYALWMLSLKNRDTGGFDDFNVFFHAGKRLLNGQNIYGEPHHYNLKYFYSVLFAAWMSSMQGMGIVGAKWVWFVLNFVLLFRTLFILKSMIPEVTKGRILIMFVLMLIMSKIILINYVSNQITIVILWTVLEAYIQLKNQRTLLAAAIICLGINIKILPIVVVPYMLYMANDKMRFLLAGLGFLLIYTFVPALMFGWDYNLMLLGEWAKTLNPVSDIHVMQTYEYGILDISSLITKFLSDEPVYLEPKLNFASWSKSQLFILTNIIRVLCLSGAFYLALKVKKPIAGISQHVIVLAAFMVLAPLCFPHQREYSYLFYSPLWLVIMIINMQERKWSGWLMFLVLVMFSGLLTWVDFVGRPMVDIFNFYRIITMGMFCMFWYYIWMIQRRNAQNN